MSMTKIFLYILLLGIGRCQMAGASEELTADSLMALSRQCYQADHLIEALDYATQTLRQAKKEGNENIYMAGLAHVASIYGVFKDYDKAHQYFRLCLEQAKMLKDSDMISRCYSNLTMTSCMLEHVDSAKYYLQLQKRHVAADTLRHQFFYLSNQGKVAAAEGDWQHAVSFAKQARDYAALHGMGIIYEASEVGQMADGYEHMGNDSMTVALYREMLQMVQEIGDMKGASRAYEHLADRYRKMGNMQMAAYYQEMSVRLTDSVFNNRDFNRVKERLTGFEEEQKAEQISLLNGRISMQLLVITLIIALLIAVIVMSVVLIRRNRSLQTAYQVLAEKNKETVRQNREPVRQTEGEHLPPEQHQQLLAAIEEVMQRDDIICNPDFDLAALCTQVGSNAKYVSWVINDHYHLSFKALLNNYRIRLASKRLADEANYGHLTIHAIAESVGYKSQTNFIQTFKSIVGMPPSIYQKMVRHDHQQS